MQGAKVATSAFVDTLDIMDLDFLSIGENAVVGEGATILGHYFKDGDLVFSKVSITEIKHHHDCSLARLCHLLHPFSGA